MNLRDKYWSNEFAKRKDNCKDIRNLTKCKNGKISIIRKATN